MQLIMCRYRGKDLNLVIACKDLKTIYIHMQGSVFYQVKGQSGTNVRCIIYINSLSVHEIARNFSCN